MSCSLLGRDSLGWLCPLSPVPSSGSLPTMASVRMQDSTELLCCCCSHGHSSSLVVDWRSCTTMVWWVCRRQERQHVHPSHVLGGVLPPCPSLVTCSEVLFSEKGELKKALMVSSTTVSTYFSSVASGRRFSRFLHICEDGEDTDGTRESSCLPRGCWDHTELRDMAGDTAPVVTPESPDHSPQP